MSATLLPPAPQHTVEAATAPSSPIRRDDGDGGNDNDNDDSENADNLPWVERAFETEERGRDMTTNDILYRRDAPAVAAAAAPRFPTREWRDYGYDNYSRTAGVATTAVVGSGAAPYELPRLEQQSIDNTGLQRPDLSVGVPALGVGANKRNGNGSGEGERGPAAAPSVDHAAAEGSSELRCFPLASWPTS